ncbi:DUF3391 domain-containing protein [Schlegelella sp. ID0723]|uniref:DUF3391 domain-containing protein n=2 Tax=Piscinibacter koreensis TaxID=2742824 RepID=A0A7Y6NMM7_9BURK|nr:DUF3391 domain-containing protein [Schlegelella koreensis]
MFVHLDGGWMSHPFPRSSFKITSEAQLARIRGLGVAQVRWDPARSDLPPAAEPASAAPVEASAPEAMAPDAPAPDAAPLTAEEPVPLLDAKLGAAARAERQFDEASRACKQATDLATRFPEDSRDLAEAITRTLLDQVLIEGELNIRVLTERAGEPGSMHSVNVAVLALLLGRYLSLTEADMLDLGVAAILHDVGKALGQPRVRGPEADIGPVEGRVHDEHVAEGVALAKRMGLSAGATRMIAQHHENVDGSGFPEGLSGEQMSVPARVLALVNRYDNLCNPPFADQALTPHEALSLLFTQRSAKLDISILSAFIRMMGVYPPGSTVQLTDDRLGLVVSVNSMRPLRPAVLIHEAGVARADAELVDLAAKPGLGIRRSLKPSQLPAAALEFLAPPRRVAYFFEPAPPPPDLAQAAGRPLA